MPPLDTELPLLELLVLPPFCTLWRLRRRSSFRLFLNSILFDLVFLLDLCNFPRLLVLVLLPLLLGVLLDFPPLLFPLPLPDLLPLDDDEEELLDELLEELSLLEYVTSGRVGPMPPSKDGPGVASAADGGGVSTTVGVGV